MKSKWRFRYETKDFYFENEIRYKGNLKCQNSNHWVGIPEHFAIDIRITPDDKNKNPNVEQVGSLFITIPLTCEVAKSIIHDIVYLISQKISFASGKFNIHGGMHTCERIPETPEEAEQIGDKVYDLHMSIEEVSSPPPFNPEFLVNNKTGDLGLLAQYNLARSISNPIDRFLNFFKILESQFHPGTKKQSLKDAFLSNPLLYDIFKETFSFKSATNAQESYLSFIESIIHARHRCAHLKKKNDFGYTPGDPKIKNEIEPFLIPLEELTYKTILMLESPES